MTVRCCIKAALQLGGGTLEWSGRHNWHVSVNLAVMSLNYPSINHFPQRYFVTNLNQTVSPPPFFPLSSIFCCSFISLSLQFSAVPPSTFFLLERSTIPPSTSSTTPSTTLFPTKLPTTPSTFFSRAYSSTIVISLELSSILHQSCFSLQLLTIQQPFFLYSLNFSLLRDHTNKVTSPLTHSSQIPHVLNQATFHRLP